jgi:hypothetical protein
MAQKDFDYRQLSGTVGENAYGESYLRTTQSREGALPLSAFGDLRTIELTPQVQLTFDYTVTNTELAVQENINSGAVSQAEGMAVVSTGTTTGSKAEIESRRHAKYRAGFGCRFRATGLFETAGGLGDGSYQVIGLADKEGVGAVHTNGLAFGYKEDIFGVFRWANNTEYFTPQTDWDYPMDGTGLSGMVLDPSKLNIYEVTFQYLGAGKITFAIEEDKTGLIYPVHTIQYTNKHTKPSSHNPNYHLMLHNENGTGTLDLVSKTASMAFFVEGKTEYAELHQPQFTTGIASKTSVTSLINVCTIRNKDTYAGKTNYLDVLIEGVSCAVEASSNNNLASIQLLLNPTLGGVPSWADINTANSLVEKDSVGTTVTGGKLLMFIPLAGKNDKAIIDLTPYRIVLQPGESMTIAAESNASATINASTMWKELV